MVAKFLMVACAVVFAADSTITAPLSDFKVTDPAGEASENVGYNEGEGKLFFYTVGVAKQTVKADADGDYSLVLDMSCDEAEKQFAKVKVTLNGKVVEKEFKLTQADQKEYKIGVKLTKGENKLEIEFLNDLYKEGEYDMNLYVFGAKFEPAKKKSVR